MKAFNNNQELKNEVLADLKKHQEMDDFIQGSWLQNETNDAGEFKGCFYGCTMQTKNDPIEAFSDKYNIDLWYCYLTEKIFEGLPKDEARFFPYQSIEKIPLNFDFNIFKSEFFKALLTKQKEWITEENVVKVLVQCIELFSVPFDKISKEAAEEAELAARAVAGPAAWPAAWVAARSAVRSAESAVAGAAAMAAARSAERSAGPAAWPAAWVAARSAVRSAGPAAWAAARSAVRAAESAVAEAAEAAERAAREADTNHYIWMRDLIFELLEKK